MTIDETFAREDERTFVRSSPAGGIREVAALAAQIAANAPLTIAAVKASLQEMQRPQDQRDNARLAELVDACFRSDDYREGKRAFAERRPPRFMGR